MKNNRRASIGSDAIKIAVSKTITLIITMLSTMLLSRYRTLEEYGTYAEMLLIVNIVISVFMMGLPNSINYFLAKRESLVEKKEFLSNYYTLSTAISILIGVVLVAFLPLLQVYFDNYYLKQFSFFLLIYPWALIVTSSIENVLIVYQKSVVIIAYRFLHSALLLTAIITSQLLNLDFKVYLIIFISVYSVFSMVVYFIVSKLCGGLTIRINKVLLREVFSFSIPLGIASVVGMLDIEIDKLLIGYMLPTAQMAVYANASKELPVTFIAASITAVLLPQMVSMINKGKDRDAVALWGDATELSVFFLAFVVAVVFTYASDVINILYSDKYLSGIGVFRVYVIILLLRCTYFGTILNAKGQTKKILLCSIIALIVNVIANPVFYRLLGMIGPAVATFLSMVVLEALQLFYSSKSVGVPFANIFPWKHIAIILVVNIGFSLFFYLIKCLLPMDEWIGSISESILLGIVWLGLYYVSCRKRIKELWTMIN